MIGISLKHMSNWKREKPFGSTEVKLFTHYVLRERGVIILAYPIYEREEWNNQLGQKNNTFVSGNTGDEKNLQPGGYKN